MKLKIPPATRCIVLLLVTLLFSISLFSQITLDINNKSIKQSLRLIEKNSAYKFFYNNDLKGLEKQVSLNISDKDIDVALKQLLANSDISYKMQEGNIILLFSSKDAELQDPERTLTGVVKDDSGETIIGASVVIKGKSGGTITDVNGLFSIKAPKDVTLIVSYVGYLTQEIKIGNRVSFDIVLKEDSKALDEVVVVGYGVQKKVHLTGSIASVSEKDILKTTSSNISQALVGKLPGIITQQATGAPGADDVSIMVRGYSSYNGGDGPLMLVDGVERPMWRVDPNDIESVTILKDAAASAVYGMKGAAGVILITTKRGTEGKTSINYRGSTTLSHATQLPKFMNGTQYMKWYNAARYLDGESPYFTSEEIAMTSNGDPSDGLENTDWQSPLFRTTFMHQHNVSVSGGGSKALYFVSGGVMQQNGFIKNHKMERGSFRSNIDTKPTKDISVSLDVSARVDDFHQPGADSYENQVNNNVVGVLLYSAPFVPIEYNGYPTSGYRTGSNPLYAANNSGFKKVRTLKLETSTKIEYATPFLEGLKASMFVSWDWQDRDSKDLKHAYKVMQYDISQKQYFLQDSRGLKPGGYMSVGDEKEQQVILRPSISYNNTFGNHAVGALFLYEQTKRKNSILSANRTEFPLFDIPDLGFGTEIHPSDGNYGSTSHSAYAGFIGRLNHAYNNRYLTEFTFRYDGSYLFAKGNRWGFFPSLSLGWLTSEEDFFKDLFPQIDHFKVRGSVGVLGRDNVNPYLFRKSYSWLNNSVAFGDTPLAQNTLYNAVSYPMEGLTWEKSRTINVGFELIAWKGLLSVEFDAFYKYTYDILQSVGSAYPPSLGGHYPSIENTGTFDNKGFEVVLKHNNKIGNVNYNLNGNLTFAQNRILSKTESDNILPWQSVLGTSIGEIWGLKSDGLYQTQEELNNASAPIGSAPRLGDIKYVDINGDGKITWDDQVKIARSTLPEMMFALMADASWNNFDVSIQLQGAALSDKMLQGEWNNGVQDQTPLTRPWYGGWDNAPLYLVENSWRPEKPNAEYPRLSTIAVTNNAYTSDFWKRNGAYLRLKNVTLGYTFPQRWIQKAGLSNLRVFASGYNLLTLTDFKYLDPESQNVIQGYYPQQRTFSFGVDVSF